MTGVTPRQDLIAYRNHCVRMAARMRKDGRPRRRREREQYDKTLAQWDGLVEETNAWLDRPAMVDLDDRVPTDADVPLMGG